LKQAEMALRDAGQRKDEFLAMLVHELRNPFAPIRNAAHVLGQLGLDEPRLRWAQGMITQQVAHLNRLVDDLLDVSRIARGKINLKIERLNLDELVRLARESVEEEMAAKGHRFAVHLPEARVKLDGDPVRLVQVLRNLLANAAKYTADGGRIELSAKAGAGEVVIEVRDTGMGIAPDLLPDIFDLFRQGERTLDRSQGGLGIGLTLVRRLVEMHGGRVEAHSAGPGLGATFSVHLPLASPQASQTAAVPVKNAQRAAAGLRVLVVDDDPPVSESMCILLELEGHEVRCVLSGDAALELLKTFRPEVVLLDIGLPGQDGYTVARRIRDQPEGNGIRLVAVSGYGHEEAIVRSREAGFDSHLVKPVEPASLLALLAEFGGQRT
jgi:CheY-like chemotaxis protein/two-component sensor histidine kinase